jgi:hypothetical protein
MATAVVATGAGAMSAPSAGHCRVIGGEKMPTETGGATAFCAAIERAVKARAPSANYSAEVRVVSKSGLAAKLVAGGRELPEQHFSVSDRDLNPDSLQRFAEAIAEQIAKASGR